MLRTETYGLKEVKSNLQLHFQQGKSLALFQKLRISSPKTIEIAFHFSVSPSGYHPTHKNLM
jgi:hypothetical protein